MSLHGQDSLITENFVRYQSRFVLTESFVRYQSRFVPTESFVRHQSFSLIINQVSFITSFVFGGQAGRVIISIYNGGFWPQSHRGLFGTILKASLRYFVWRMDFVVSSGTPLPRSPPVPLPSLIVGLKVSISRTIIHARTVTTLTTNTRD